MTVEEAATKFPRSCATCLFFRKDDGDKGFCHRYPPQVLGGGGAWDSSDTQWPQVRSIEWCGEWQLRRPNEVDFFKGRYE